MADKYTHLVFNKNKLLNENFFSMLTAEANYKIECLFKGKLLKHCKRSKLYDEKSGNKNYAKNLQEHVKSSNNESSFKENILSYSVWNMQVESKRHESKDYINEIFLNYLNESRTLTSRFDVVIENKEEKILIETRLSKKRNFINDMYFFHNFR